MIVTHTELIDLLRKLFEGLGYELGEDDDCAKAVAWLAMRDYPILQQLSDQPAQFRPAERIVIEREAGGDVTVNASEGNSIALIADLLRYKLLEHEKVVMLVIGSPFPTLILPYLAQIGGVASWDHDELMIVGSRSTEPTDQRSVIYQRHLENGLFIEDVIWEKLKRLARAVLVPESDYSRRHGAG